MINDICKKWGIENYTINDDGSIDVQGNVDLSDMGLTKLPIKFRNVTGYFYCSYNQLVTLEGSPQRVGGDFYCYNNQLGGEYKGLYRSEQYSLLIKRINRHKKLDQLFS
jgi:hypothetical protein